MSATPTSRKITTFLVGRWDQENSITNCDGRWPVGCPLVDCYPCHYNTPSMNTCRSDYNQLLSFASTLFGFSTTCSFVGGPLAGPITADLTGHVIGGVVGAEGPITGPSMTLFFFL